MLKKVIVIFIVILLCGCSKVEIRKASSLESSISAISEAGENSFSASSLNTSSCNNLPPVEMYEYVPQSNEEDVLYGACDDKSGLWGYINKNGEWIIEPKFARTVSLDYFHENYAYFNFDILPAKQEGLYGYIDRNGNWIIKPRFKFAHMFTQGLGKVVNNAGDSFYIDKNGNIVYNKYLNLGMFTEGLAARYAYSYEERKNGANSAIGYVNTNGSWVIPPQFYSSDIYGDTSQSLLFAFFDGLARMEKDGKWGYINREGSWEIPPQYEGSGSFSNGLAPVRTDGKWGFIDKTGEWAIDPIFGFVQPFSEGLAAAFNGTKWGFIDKTGNWIIAAQYIYNRPMGLGGSIFSFHNGRALVPSFPSGDFLFVDKSGNFLFNSESEYSYEYVHGITLVNYIMDNRSKNAYIDIEGNIVFEWLGEKGIYSEK
jgi:hypothetical protein